MESRKLASTWCSLVAELSGSVLHFFRETFWQLTESYDIRNASQR